MEGSRAQALSWGWARTAPASGGGSCFLLSHSADPRVTHCPLPQDILRYTVSSTLLLRLVSTGGQGSWDGRTFSLSSSEVRVFIKAKPSGLYIYGSGRFSGFFMSPVLAGHSLGLEYKCPPTACRHTALGLTLDSGTHCSGGVSGAGVLRPEGPSLVVPRPQAHPLPLSPSPSWNRDGRRGPLGQAGVSPTSPSEK